MSANILLSDTNILIKILLFPGKDIQTISYPSYGLIKFHPIAVEEITKWKVKFEKTGKHMKVTKFGMPFIESAIKAGNEQLFSVGTDDESLKKKAFKQYESIAIRKLSNSMQPSESDLLLVYHAEINACHMVTNDNIIYQIGLEVLENKSLKLEDLIADLYNAGVLTMDDVMSYEKALKAKDEDFELGYFLSRRTR